ncbi:hypothetical protein [Pedobacter frigoris]|uniref:hypothetical protein n=1 Tax=Pedobacter frigoris TaxID=2571272 RepID=UPI0029300461|nr:hypothetical protein [Pedobacter frigoris]
MEVKGKNKRELPKKYKIQECLNNLTKSEYDEIVKKIPGIMGKCNTTVNNYKNIPEGSKEEIPYSVGLKYERIFELPSGGLLNTEIRCLTYKELTKKK